MTKPTEDELKILNALHKFEKARGMQLDEFTKSVFADARTNRKCNFCGVQFTNIDALSRHLDRHI